MNLFARKNKRNRYDIAIDDNTAPISNMAFTGSNSYEMFNVANRAGVSVTEQSALSVSTVYACVSLLAGVISSLPIHIYERSADGHKRANLDLWWLLNESPNENVNAASLWQSVIASLLLHGDGFIRIRRSGDNKYATNIKSLEWIHSGRVTVIRKPYGKVYLVDPLPFSVNDQSQSVQERVYSADMIQIMGASGPNDIRGISALQNHLKTAISISLAADRYSAAFFENGARPDFVIKHPGNPTSEQVTTLRESWANRHAGPTNAHLPAVLAGGMDVTSVTLSAEDSQLLMTRQFQVEDVCRAFLTPPHMVGHTQNASSWGTGIEQMSLGFLKYTLMPHLRKIEQELNRKLWPVNPKYFVAFDTAELTRGDYKTRMESYRVGLGRAGEPGWTTINEIRKAENMPPIEGGDEINKGDRVSVSETPAQANACTNSATC